MFFAIEKKVNLYDDFFEIYDQIIILCFSATINNITTYYFFAPKKFKKKDV